MRQVSCSFAKTPYLLNSHDMEMQPYDIDYTKPNRESWTFSSWGNGAHSFFCICGCVLDKVKYPYNSRRIKVQVKVFVQ